MAIFYILQEPTSFQFLSDLKLGHWDGYFDPSTEQIADCVQFKTRKAAFLARDKMKKLLMIQNPKDSEESCEVRVCEVHTEVIKKMKIVHSTRAL